VFSTGILSDHGYLCGAMLLGFRADLHPSFDDSGSNACTVSGKRPKHHENDANAGSNSCTVSGRRPKNHGNDASAGSNACTVSGKRPKYHDTACYNHFGTGGVSRYDNSYCREHSRV
jgi:hypothetical protein